MADVLTFPPVTDRLLVEVVRRILTIGTPFKVVLFGSHAKGTARPDSDLDLSRVIQISPVRVIENSPPGLGGCCRFVQSHQPR
ncbi:MAG: nucleotidyltransferase domain-containing protein, partial [Nitrospira sp.]|nr:nucleotidyltransferase domain-containing protein [Nitrospira sp.]MBH0183249.1 nucleotidyltransferase domain-containing protein [Nitrospira sp.]MBH0186916.1 nucleotidyltransferase domain-containing protein [Nitrospira sp.]